MRRKTDTCSRSRVVHHTSGGRGPVTARNRVVVVPTRIGQGEATISSSDSWMGRNGTYVPTHFKGYSSAHSASATGVRWKGEEEWITTGHSESRAERTRMTLDGCKSWKSVRKEAESTSGGKQFRGGRSKHWLRSPIWN